LTHSTYRKSAFTLLKHSAANYSPGRTKQVDNARTGLKQHQSTMLSAYIC